MSFTKINAAGIGSTETVTINGLSVIGDGSFGGNVSVAGTLTYEDVTNIDSVGLITARNGIVVGTGNKVEDFGVGFYTKYGDGGVDISPIADCTKTQVWELGKHLGVSEKIINSQPTDGLWDDGRNDVPQLGMSYEDLEKAMDNKDDPNYQKYLKIREKNLHKMNPIPVCKFNE